MKTQQNVKQLGRFAIFSQRLSEQFRTRLYPKQKQPTMDAVEQNQKLTEVVNKAQEVLLEVSSVFPFMMFPDSLRIDRQKVILTHRSFFGVAQVINIQIEDLQAIEADISPLFGSLSITTRQYENTVHDIHRLSRRDAIAAQSLLQGFVLAKQQKLDYSKIDRRELVQHLKNLGANQV